MEIVPSTFLDTQSSLKLTTVYAVSEDSHRGGPVLLERLMNRRTHTPTQREHTHTNTNTHTADREKQRDKRKIDDGYVYMHKKSQWLQLFIYST